MSNSMFIRNWVMQNPGRKMPAHVFEGLRSLHRAWEVIQPAYLPRPAALWAMMRFDPFTREYSSIREVPLAEFMHRVVDPSSPDSDPYLWRDVEEGVRTAIFRVGRHWHRVVLTENHLGLREYLNYLPVQGAGDGLGQLTIAELAAVLEQRSPAI